MKLAELAFACYIYGRMTDYDESYNRFRRETNPQLDLNDSQHRLALIKWLNSWGCRQFAIDYHDLASEEIHSWYQQFGSRFFQFDKSLLDLASNDLTLIEQAYANLATRTASMRNGVRGGSTKVVIGPTGTAKILFALRPNALIPWDEPIRSNFQFDGSAHTYIEYLHVVKENLEELDQACKKIGHQLSDLPQLIDRRTSSLAKLIDEYFWVTVSRNCSAPTSDKLMKWAGWW